MDRYHYPPRVMFETEAARYVGLTVEEFRACKHPSPFKVSPRRLGWDRADLDGFVDEMKAGAPSAAYAETPVPDSSLPPPPRTVFTPAELAERWQVDRATVIRRWKEGLVPGFRVGKLTRFPITKILELEREQGFDPQSSA